MEHDESQETAATFMPVIPRLDRLDRLLQLLEEKHSLSRRDFCGNTCAVDAGSNVDECKTLSSALDEVHRKGTLIERLVLLENRVLQLSLEMDEGNTSKSSTSTVEVSEMTAKESELLSIPKRQDESPPPLTAQEMQLPAMTPPQESVVVREGSRQHKNKGKKKKVPKRWLGLFRLTC
ncbi:uncharacterized protein LOC105162309 [Sesamum indicum]|uniref:Uncharacterized protein LOC105162309 n=1 Tax=Sesamum indicum TaxID=4182 RepID=A0A6I9T653_SESIN|nr:uncharacterized protein LOC105162309 [Sesamum indicum]